MVSSSVSSSTRERVFARVVLVSIRTLPARRVSSAPNRSDYLAGPMLCNSGERVSSAQLACAPPKRWDQNAPVEWTAVHRRGTSALIVTRGLVCIFAACIQLLAHS